MKNKGRKFNTALKSFEKIPKSSRKIMEGSQTFWRSPKFSKVLTLYFRFSYIYIFLAGNIIVYTPSEGTNGEKYRRNV